MDPKITTMLIFHSCKLLLELELAHISGIIESSSVNFLKANYCTSF